MKLNRKSLCVRSWVRYAAAAATAYTTTRMPGFCSYPESPENLNMLVRKLSELGIPDSRLLQVTT